MKYIKREDQINERGEKSNWKVDTMREREREHLTESEETVANSKLKIFIFDFLLICSLSLPQSF